MPMIWLPRAELEALQAMFSTAEKVDWAAYERAKLFILYPQPRWMWRWMSATSSLGRASRPPAASAENLHSSPPPPQYPPPDSRPEA